MSTFALTTELAIILLEVDRCRLRCCVRITIVTISYDKDVLAAQDAVTDLLVIK